MNTADSIPADLLAHRLSKRRVASAGGLAMAIIFIICWVGTFIPFSSPTHAFIGLFTPAEQGSVAALLEGTMWSLLFGALSGVVFSAVYNMLAGLGRNT